MGNDTSALSKERFPPMMRLRRMKGASVGAVNSVLLLSNEDHDQKGKEAEIEFPIDPFSNRQYPRHARREIPIHKQIPETFHLRPKKSNDIGFIRYQYVAETLPLAIEESNKTRKPILLIKEDQQTFATGKPVHQNVLCHPLIVEAAETLFVTVLSTSDLSPLPGTNGKRKRSKADEVVLRIMCEEDDIVQPFVKESLAVAGLAHAMIVALSINDMQVPKYLQLLADEGNSNSCVGLGGGTEASEAVFGVKCFEEAELGFGTVDGVLATKTGWTNHKKIVNVSYDSSKVSYCRLVEFALENLMTHSVFFQNFDEKALAQEEVNKTNSAVNVDKFVSIIQPNIDPKSALRTTVLRFVPLTELQKLRGNRYCNFGSFDKAVHLLSPRQFKILQMSFQRAQKQEWRDLSNVSISTAWFDMRKQGWLDF